MSQAGHLQNLKSSQTRYLGKMNQVEDPFKMQTTYTTTVPASPTTSTTTPPPSLTGSISGTIMDTSGDPVGGVRVVVVDSDLNMVGNYYNWSDSEGHYVADDIPTGDYYVVVVINQ